MKIKNLFVVALASIVALAACKKEPVVTPPADLTIKLNAAVYGFTKATDTAFEAGDAMGVNVYEGENSYIFNAKFTYNGSALTSVTEYKWYEDTETVGTITAYYPYVSLSESATALTFTVNTDQSSAEKYKGSDFMVATTSSKPTEEAINLNFKHALSKVVVTVDNQLSEAIQDVWLTDVLGSVTFDLKTGAVAATGSQGNVKGYKSSDNTWQLIIAPQTANPKLALTTASGKQYTFVLSEGVTFSAGKYSTAAVTVNDATVSTLFTPNIENWVADNELNFGQDEIIDNDDNLGGDDNGEENGDDNGEENGEENGDDNGDDNGEDEGEGEENNTTTSEVRIYLASDWGWTYLWCWDSNGTQIFGEVAWPGTVKHGEVEGYYYWVVPEAYVGQTVNLLAAKKNPKDDGTFEEEQSKDYVGLTLSKDVYFHLEWKGDTDGVQLILEDK